MYKIVHVFLLLVVTSLYYNIDEVLHVATIGERIKDLRKKKDLTQIELSKKLEISRSTIASWESNRRVPELGTAKILADFFDVSVDFLLGRVDSPTPTKPRELPDTAAPYLPEGFDELSPEARKEVLDFIDYVMVKYAKKEEDKK